MNHMNNFYAPVDPVQIEDESAFDWCPHHEPGMYGYCPSLLCWRPPSWWYSPPRSLPLAEDSLMRWEVSEVMAVGCAELTDARLLQVIPVNYLLAALEGDNENYYWEWCAAIIQEVRRRSEKLRGVGA